MDIQKLKYQFQNIFEVEDNNGELKITAPTTLSNRQKIVLFVSQIDGEFYVTDKKEILKFMNTLYDLKSIDVKNCITSVLKIYGFAIFAGELRAKISNESAASKTLLDTICCIYQLVNMYAFFDNP